MGAGLAALALSQPGVNPAARLVLVRMALTAHDRDPEPVYWGGWEFLALQGLGYEAYTPAAERAVAKAVRSLENAGLIKTRRAGKPGARAEYVLTMAFR